MEPELKINNFGSATLIFFLSAWYTYQLYLLYLTCSLMMVTTVVRASLIMVLFLMVSTLPDMLPHDGDYCGEGQPDVRTVPDGDHYA